MLTKKIITAFCTGTLLFAVASPRIAQASYGFISQFTGGDCTTSGPNSYSLVCTKINGQTVQSLAFQAAGALAATGGSINGVTVGAITPASVTATSITNTAAVFKNISTITSGASYTLQATDNIVDVNKTTGSATAITLITPTKAMEIEIKDKKGDSVTNNITISPASGTIDGQTNVVLNNAYANAVLRFDPTAGSWSLY